MVFKGNDKTVESAYPRYKTEQDWRENTEEILSNACKSMFSSGFGMKKGVVSTNQTELRKHELVPYYRTKDFKKKIG